MMHMKRIELIGLVLACCLLGGCQALEKKQQAGAAVELNGRYLYYSTLDSLTLGLNSEDSARVRDQYIRQWAQDILLYDNATSRTNEEIEAMVDNYRTTLYVRAYEERLVAKRMPKQIADSTIIALYEQMPGRFQLDESIMRGMLLVVPLDAPKMDKLRTWLTRQDMDAIEKYAYQNASGYDLFTDRWLTTTEMIGRIPLERAELESRLKTKNQIEVKDSTKTYLLQITEKHIRGEAMPIDYARPEIEKMVLYARQADFLRAERERLYKEAVETKKITFFD
jgi:hypothetical protein